MPKIISTIVFDERSFSNSPFTSIVFMDTPTEGKRTRTNIPPEMRQSDFVLTVPPSLEASVRGSDGDASCTLHIRREGAGKDCVIKYAIMQDDNSEIVTQADFRYFDLANPLVRMGQKNGAIFRAAAEQQKPPRALRKLHERATNEGNQRMTEIVRNKFSAVQAKDLFFYVIGDGLSRACMGDLQLMYPGQTPVMFGIGEPAKPTYQ